MDKIRSTQRNRRLAKPKGTVRRSIPPGDGVLSLSRCGVIPVPFVPVCTEPALLTDTDQLAPHHRGNQQRNHAANLQRGQL